jgi:hypothetical protein
LITVRPAGPDAGNLRVLRRVALGGMLILFV